MFGKVILRLGPGIRALGTAGALLVLAVGSVGTAGATTTLQDLFYDADGLDSDSDGAFTRGDLTFSDFAPIVSPSLPDAASLAAILSTQNPSMVANIPFFDFSGGGVFSRGWVNANAAEAGNITVEILEDNLATGGFDPGFRLEGNNEWHVDAGYSDNVPDKASAQLSAFTYTVSNSGNKPLTSADLAQFSTINAVGPDVVGFPDVAAGLSLQFVLLPGNTDLANAPWNYTLESGYQTSTGVMALPFDQDYDWVGFNEPTSIQVISVILLGATSEGGFTMEALEQRIDPPNPAIPEPQTALLLLMGMLGIGAVRRRVG